MKKTVKRKTTKKKAVKKPSAGLTKKQKSNVAKKARAGKDIGKRGKAFKEVEDAAYKFYRKKGKSVKVAREIARKTAAAQMWRSIKRKK